MLSLKLRKAIFITTLHFLLSCFPVFTFSQYILNGAATQNSCNCYTLTPAQFTQTGSVWNSNKINLNNSFDFNFNVFLGCVDANGADGIVFILQPISTSLGTSGGGMGFEGIAPSIGVALDTWQNTENNDPVFDHVSIQANGVISHGSDLQGPVQASDVNPNIEDCIWHDFRIKWNAVSKIMEVYFDGVLRLSYSGDIINTFFSGDPNVYWGFTAATGGANNLQQFCTALNPAFTTNAMNDAVCVGTPVIFNEASVSFAQVQSWYWDFGDGNTSTLQTPPPHIYNTPGIYQVKLAIRGLDGCTSDTLLKTVTIGSKPIADFQIFDTCMGKPVRVINQSTNLIGTINQWVWMVDGFAVSTDQQPDLSTLIPEPHAVKLVVKSTIGCESDTVTKTVIINRAPTIDMITENGCLNEPVNFFGTQLDNATWITQWNWNFGDGGTSVLQDPVHTYSPAGTMTVQLNATESNGCISTPIIKTISIGDVSVRTIRDTTILPNIPFLLNSTWSSISAGTPSFSWTPSAGLDDPFDQNPRASITDDETYIVTATTAEGCEASDTVNIKVFKGSAVYVPTGFTPNGDGRNDFLRGLYIGIKKVDYFRVYNRWGQLIFSTNTLIDGWDGTIKGVKQATGTYVWMLRAEDLAGKIYEMKGTSTLIR
jgi:gliding motility-associated-like protein